MLFEDAKELTFEGVLSTVTDEDDSGRVFVDIDDKGNYGFILAYFYDSQCFSDMEEFFGRIDYFKSSGKVRKDKLMEKMLDICAERDDRNAEIRFFKDLLEKGFIEKADTSMCIKKMRAKNRYQLIPLMVLKDAGEFSVNS